MPRGIIMTYSRRHQLREVKTEKEDSWGNVVGGSKNDAIFGSSHSSGFDSSSLLSESSIDKDKERTTHSRAFKVKDNKDNSESSRKTGKNNGGTRKKGKIAQQKCNNESNVFESSADIRSPLSNKDANAKVSKKPRKKAAQSLKKKRKRVSSIDKENDGNEMTEHSIEKERQDVKSASPFAEFEEFSLCIEEEQIEEKEVVVDAPSNLTQSPSSSESVSSAKPEMNRPLPQIHTSTPTMNHKPTENLFKRLTRSNLKKMTAAGLGTPKSLLRGNVSHSLLTPGYGMDESAFVSPAYSNISKRDSLESNIGHIPVYDTANSINDSVSILPSQTDRINTRRRTKQKLQRNISNSGINSPVLNMSSSFNIDNRRNLNQSSIQMEYEVLQTGDESDELEEEEDMEEEEEDHSEEIDEDGEEDLSVEDLSDDENIDIANVSQRFDGLHISIIEEEQEENISEEDDSSLSINCDNHSPVNENKYECTVNRSRNTPEQKIDGDIDTRDQGGGLMSTSKNRKSCNENVCVKDVEVVVKRLSDSLLSELSKSGQTYDLRKHNSDSTHKRKRNSIRECNIVLERMSDSLVSEITNSGKSHGRTYAVSEYDASKSLFEDFDIDHTHQNLDSEVSSEYVTAGEDSNLPVARNLQTSESFQSCERNSEFSGSEDDGQKPDSDQGTWDSSSESKKNCRNRLDTIKECGELVRSFQCLTPVRHKKSGIILSPRTKVLMHCDQENPVSFSNFIPQAMMKKCTKIGEGVYGEVFRSENRTSSIALKIIPIEGDFHVNDEPQKTFAEVLPEIVVSLNLSDLKTEGPNSTPNFVQVNRCGVIQGSFPKPLLKEWDKFHERKVSENDRPDMYPDTQLFLIFDFEDSGTDLESFKFKSIAEAKSVLYQVTLSIAVAEVAIEFEHRDLHWGNVLLKRTDEASFLYTLDNVEFEVQSHGVKVAIIDFTLSRMSKDGVTSFSNLALDPTMFDGQGDYQFDVYRLMRDETKNDWEPFHPYTNILWIHYLADKLFNFKSYPGSSSKEHRSISREFRTLIREMTDYNSAVHLVTSCPFFTDSQ